MDIKSAKFVKGITGPDAVLERELPQIAFVGRSNAGKSSIINTLVGKKDLAVSSSTPGRTLQLNFFLINDNTFFVDLPGYGYSKISITQAEKTREMILWYLESGDVTPKKVVLIVDANVGLTKFDLEMIELLNEEQHDYVVVANKVDKIKSSELSKKKRAIAEVLKGVEVIYFSTKTKAGKGELLAKIMA